MGFKRRDRGTARRSLTSEDVGSALREPDTEQSTQPPHKAAPINIPAAFSGEGGDIGKSHICRAYYLHGYCAYGDECQYAHIRGLQKREKHIVSEHAEVMERAARASEKRQRELLGSAPRCSSCDTDLNVRILSCGHALCDSCHNHLLATEEEPKCLVCGRSLL